MIQLTSLARFLAIPHLPHYGPSLPAPTNPHTLTLPLTSLLLLSILFSVPHPPFPKPPLPPHRHDPSRSKDTCFYTSHTQRDTGCEKGSSFPVEVMYSIYSTMPLGQSLPLQTNHNSDLFLKISIFRYEVDYYI